MSLEIFIITYNRSHYLSKTLGYLSDSLFRDFKITILNNCSTDNTIYIVEDFKNQFSNLKIVTHKNNIGAGANVMRAFELASSTYVWVLCDDDFLNLQNVDDVLKVVEKEEIDLIQIGAHPTNEWANYAGKTKTPRQLLADGYPYFMYSSFLPGSIFKTKKIQENFLLKGYDNIHNGYPHLPYLFDVFNADSLVYLSKEQLVTANGSGQSYDNNIWFVWWIDSCKLLMNKQDVRLAFLNHFEGQVTSQGLKNSVWNLASKGQTERRFLINFFDEYFDVGERKTLVKYMDPYTGIRNEIKKRLKQLRLFSRPLNTI